MSDKKYELTREQVAAYHGDGFVIVPGLYPDQTMLEWKRILSKAVEREDLPAGVRVWNPAGFPAGLLDAMRDEHVTPILHQLIGPSVEFLSAKAVFKNPKVTMASPWHQDWFYWHGASKLSIWIALDDATPDNGCLMFLRGSHTRVFRMKQVGGVGFVNQIDPSEIDPARVQTIAVKRGDAVFFHDLAVHSSYPNKTGADRWSFISTYRDASVRDTSELSGNLWKEPLPLRRG